ncbi:DUF6152 family protein [Novosphingobium sp. Rr 2-17]|uniref:DUF6152 family protein n=1 Tax=Novosphingobium sp. Rr 2-17 TaxID=555793 RepID=UPI00063F6451|nr:DUF6152 family protein [Novosphingobium sp. Rr 2-17]
MIAGEGTVYAHHSLSAYDVSKTITIEGTIKEYKWSAPHCWLVVMVGGAKGKIVPWTFEAGTPMVNNKFGWTRDTFTIGEKVKVTAAPMLDGTPGGALMLVEMHDGRKLAGPLATYLKK